MAIDLKTESKTWSVYFLTILIAVYIHEIGHCIPAWLNGISAIPTPAKEYILDTMPAGLQNYVSFGGILGTILVAVTMIILFWFKTRSINSAILAGTIAMPWIYSFRFILAGRGHDATEFQEAQAVMGFSYNGHSLDWIFLILFLTGAAVWIYRIKPNKKIFGRWAIGFVFTFVFVIALQIANNALFDPIFQSSVAAVNHIFGIL